MPTFLLQCGPNADPMPPLRTFLAALEPSMLPRTDKGFNVVGGCNGGFGVGSQFYKPNCS